MKKLLIIFFIVVFVMFNLKGQVTKIGGGLGLSSGFPFHGQTASANKSGVIALSLKHIHQIKGPLLMSPSFYFFFPHVTETAYNRTSVTSMMFDINFQYVFNRLDRFELYGLAGPDFLVTWKIDKYEGSVTNKEKDRLFGINLGIGTHAKVTNLLYVYGEAKYLYNNKYNQFMLSAGVLLNLDWMKKHENADLN
ncbi:MAG TPA: outer membrane beta-barrel protein [Bacteroidales bacterium]|nr:outer membrane beta-barrel protein [Bacteroidales bacterium]